MMHSIRLRLIRRLQRIRDHVSQKFVQELRGSKVHANARAYDGDSFVVGISGTCCEGQAHYPVPLGCLSDQIHVLDFNALISNEQAVGAYRQCSLGHQESPIGTVFDVSKLNAKALGVDIWRGKI